ncbi:MAG: DUF6266 family protein [Paludibacter sp.]
MATSQNPLSGQMSGTVANFVTSTRNGQNEIRSKAFNPKDANTPAQQLQRACFKIVVEEYQSFGGITDEGFPEKGPNQTGYNLFVAANLPNAIDKSGAEPVINYSKLLVANGSLPQVVVSDAKIVTEGISISYQTNVKVLKINANDEVLVVAKTHIGELLLEKKVRGEEKTGTIVIDIPGVKASDIKCCYLFVRNVDGSKASRSNYIEFL